jgi:hypothetical protein
LGRLKTLWARQSFWAKPGCVAKCDCGHLSELRFSSLQRGECDKCVNCARLQHRKNHVIPDKICSSCKEAKPDSEFAKDRSKPHGLSGLCRACHNGLRRKWNKERPQETKQSRKKYHQKNPTFRLYTQAKARAKHGEYPFTINWRKDIVIPDICPILGIPLFFGDGCVTDNSPSLDKIIPELGYVPGNMVVISHRANTLKSNGTLAEHKMLVAWLEQQSARGLDYEKT